MKQPTRVALLLLRALVAGCGGQAATPTTATPTSVPTAPAAAATTPPMTGTMTMDIGATPAFTATEAMASSIDMGGAGGAAESYGPSIAAVLPPATVDLSAFPVTVENCGRKLTFAKPPEHVVGLWQASNENVFPDGDNEFLMLSAEEVAARDPALFVVFDRQSLR